MSPRHSRVGRCTNGGDEITHSRMVLDILGSAPTLEECVQRGWTCHQQDASANVLAQHEQHFCMDICIVSEDMR